MHALKRCRHLGCALIIAAFAADASIAQSCNDLARELVRLERGSAPSQASLRYDRAYREQFAVLAAAQRSAEANACFGGGFLFFRREPRPICETLVPKIEAMRANLRKLDRLRHQEGPGAGDGRMARRIRGLMRQLDCGYGEGPRWFGHDEIFEDDHAYEPRWSGRYRTLCVRACDGYYFPISFATSRRGFGRDQTACQAMCPGAEVSLYYHRSPGGESESMVSLAGVPYTEMKNAFRYRKQYDKTCTCGTGVPGQYDVVATIGENVGPAARVADTIEVEPRKAVLAPVPRPRTGPADDPETAINRDGSFVPKAVAPPDAVASRTTVDPVGRKVRVVGPQYWGGTSKEQAVLIQAPN